MRVDRWPSTPRVSISRTPVRDTYECYADEEPEAAGVSSDRDDGRLDEVLEQIAQMRSDHTDALRRVERDARREQARFRDEHRQEKQFLTDTILSIQQSIASLKTPEPVVGQTPAAQSTNAPDGQPGETRGPIASTMRAPKPSSNDAPLPPGMMAPTAAPPGMTLQGSPPTIALTPGDISNSDDPIKLFRRDKPTSDVASIILREVGLEKAIELDKAHKGKANSKSSNKYKLNDTLWPNDYVIRLDSDEDPSYDTLTETEFVSGYISIITEVTPNIPQNAKLIQHLLYLRQLMDDCASLDWEQVRTAHRLVLMSIVHNRLDWNNAAAVKEEKAVALNRVRRKLETQPTTKSGSVGTSRGAHVHNSRKTHVFSLPTTPLMAQLHCTAAPTALRKQVANILTHKRTVISLTITVAQKTGAKRVATPKNSFTHSCCLISRCPTAPH